MKTREEIAAVNILFREAQEKGEEPPIHLIMDWTHEDIVEAISQSREYTKQLDREIRGLEELERKMRRRRG
jgi:hypothetical protein